jgi:GNAT superfamily N-acetyltransferase
MIDGDVVAIARVETSSDTSIAAAADWRARGIGQTLLIATVPRAGQMGLSRLVLRSSLRSRSVAALGASVGAVTVDQGRGRVDLIFPINFSTRTA